MQLELKSIADQVVVITGASSGIGLCTARLAAKRGARVVLASRNENALETIVRDIRDAGGDAVHVRADVSDDEQVEHLADEAVRAFGGIDTWINCAAVAIYGELRQVSLADARRLFDVNFWGVVHGCNAAVPRLGIHGGALINIGSVLSEVPMPLQGFYTASKHAVKGYTDTLRLELEHAGAPIAVTLVMPTSIDTPYVEHAKNYLDVEATLPPPVYAPDVVARTLLECAQRPVREIFVGGSASGFVATERLSERLLDRMLNRTMYRAQRTEEPNAQRDNLYAPSEPEGSERGPYPGRVMRSSLYTQARLNPMRSALVALGAGAAVAGARYLRRRQGEAARRDHLH